MAPASNSHSHPQPYEYLDALLAIIPNDTIPPEITASSPSQSVGAGAHLPYSKFIDTALRLASGGPSRLDDAPSIRDSWLEIQTSVQRALHALHPTTTTTTASSSKQQAKRKHSLSSSPNNDNENNKKLKYEDGGEGDIDDKDDAPQLTLHAISATAPVRHKVDITLHARTLRLAHSTTGAPTARCARTALTRVFLLPTRARSSGALQWTALLLAGDKPAPPAPRGGGKGAKTATTTATAVRFELACSVPDSSNSATIPRITVHARASTSSSTPTPTTTSAREAVFTLLSSTISGSTVALTTVERGAPLAGITAFRGVRETSLWFFDDVANAGAGILADGRPAEHWALADLARGEAGVRVRTATGRTCSVVFMRRRSCDDGTGERGDGEEEEEEEGEETEFQMIDGKERERILEWVRRHRGAFGIANIRGKDDEAKAQESSRSGINGREEETGGGGREDSDSDSDFEASGESDGGSPSGSSNSGSGSGSRRSDVGSDAGSGDEDEPENEDEEEDGSGNESELDDNLDPKHHPLLRAGALPKMSRAAMDAAVELTVGDLLVGPGQGKAASHGRRDAPLATGSGSGSGSESESESGESGLGSPVDGDGREGGAVDDDEEDELED